MAVPVDFVRVKTWDLQEFRQVPHGSPQVWTERLERVIGPMKNTLSARSLPADFLHIGPVENSSQKRPQMVTDPPGRSLDASSILATRGLEAAVFVFRSHL